MASELAQKVNPAESVWKHIQQVLREYINIRSYNTWFAPIEAVDLTDQYLEIRVPNRFFVSGLTITMAKF